MHPHPKSQRALYYQAEFNAGVVNSDFCWLVQHGMTREDLARNIERRPSLWLRFEGFLDKLPSRSMTPTMTTAP